MDTNKSPAAMAESLGERLKQARLNADLTQDEVARQAGVSRKLVARAEKGKVQLETMLAIMQVLQLTGQLDNFLPYQEISPIQLARLHGQKRQRASGKKSVNKKEHPEW